MSRHALPLVALMLTMACLDPASCEAIVGGAAIPRGALRGAARIDLPDDVCSGSLIGARLVLTALHCLQTPQDGVSADEIGSAAIVTVGNPNDRGRVQVRHVARVYVAPQAYSPAGFEDEVDAAILILDRRTTQPSTPLAPIAEVAPLTEVGGPLLIAGFGASVSPPPTPDRRQVVLKASVILKAAALTSVGCPPDTSEPLAAVTCARPTDAPASGVASGNGCSGDSGAPVLARSPSLGGAYAQVGTLSGATGGDGCSQANTTIFTVLDARLAAWLEAVRSTPLPTAATAPRACAAYRRGLRRIKRQVVRLMKVGRRHPAALRAARHRALIAEARVYRRC